MSKQSDGVKPDKDKKKDTDFPELTGPKMSKSAQRLIANLEDPDPEVRDSAVLTLKIKGKKSLTLLIMALGSENEDVQQLAISTLVDIAKETQEIMPSMIDAVLGVSENVCYRLLHVFRSIGKDAIPTLLDTLENGKKKQCIFAADGLAIIGIDRGGEVLPALSNKLDDKRKWVRHATASALEAFGSEAHIAVSNLQGLVGDPEWVVRLAVAKTLGGIGQAAQEALPSLKLQVSSEPDKLTQIEQRKAIGNIEGQLHEQAGAEEEVPKVP